MVGASATQSTEVTEGLAWHRRMIGDDVEAAQIFRRRGAWGDAPRRFRRLAWTLFGVGDFHPLERKMALVNAVALRRGRLELYSLKGHRRGFDVREQFASFPVRTLSWKSERRTARAVHTHGDTRSVHTTKILTLTIEPPGEPPLAIDLPAGKVTGHLLRTLER